MNKTGLTIAVDGATGYLGSHLVSRLCKNGLQVRAFVHAGANQEDVQFLCNAGAQVEVVDLVGERKALEAKLLGVDVMVHLIGSIAPKKGETLSSLHGEQTSALVRAAKTAGITKIIQVTALGTASDAPSTYHQTKWQAEQYVRNSGLKWVILRPSLIAGRQVGHRNSKLIARYMHLVKARSSVPVIGNGENRLQPVFIGDLVQCLEKAIVESRFDHRVYEIGGDEILTMRQIVERIMALEGVRKSVKGISPSVARVLATVCETFQNVPLISKDQITLSTRDNVCSDNALLSVFGVAPVTFDQALATYKQTAGRGGALESSGNRR